MWRFTKGRAAGRDGAGGGGHPLGQDVEIQEKRRRSGQHHRPTAPTPRAGSCCPTARPNATWNGPPPAPRPPTSTSAGSGRSGPRSRRWTRRPGRGRRRLLREMHKAIRDVTRWGIESFGFNAAIAKLYAFTNTLSKSKAGRRGPAHRDHDAGAADVADDPASGRGSLGPSGRRRPDRQALGPRPTRRCWSRTP
jgi:hypothetical protein